MTSYFHFTGGILINQGWLWFLPVLFLFDLLYALVSRVFAAQIKINLRGAVVAVFLIGFIYSCCMSFFNLYGWTKTILLDFQNERLFVYFMTFLLGVLCNKLDVFAPRPGKKTFFIVLCSTVWIPMNVYIIFLINLVLNPGHFIVSYIADVMLVWLGFHLSLLSLLYIMITTFRVYLNKKGGVFRRLNDYSYGVYIVHFVVMGGLALILLKTTMPSMAKYAILLVATYIVSNLIVALYKETKHRIWAP